MLFNLILKKKYVAIILVFFIISHMTFGSVIGGTHSHLSIKDLYLKVKEAEKRLVNIKIDSEAWVETKDSISAKYNRTPVFVSSTSWLNGLPGSKSRVDVHKQILNWKEGFSSYGEESFSTAFDGQYGRTAYYTSGAKDRTDVEKRGQIVPEAPRKLRSLWVDTYTGARFSLSFFFNQEGTTFSEMLAKGIDAKEDTYELTQQEFQGVKCIRFGSGKQKWGEETWWLDPSKGFALVGYDAINIRSDGTENILTRLRVNKLEEVSNGIWYPVDAYVESSPQKPKDPFQRIVYKASKVIVNNPNFDDSIFTIRFPDGYIIDDKVNGLTYMIGLPPEELLKALDDVAENIQNPSNKTTNVAPPLNIENSTSKKISTKEISSLKPTPSNPNKEIGAIKKKGVLLKLFFKIFLGGTVLLGFIILFMITKKKHHVNSIVISLLFLSIVNHIFCSKVTGNSLLGASGDFHRNCGLNAGYVALKIFNRSVDLKKLTEEFGAGSCLEKNISFSEIKKVLMSYNLNVQAYKADAFEEAIGYLDSNNLMFFRINSYIGKQNIGHFLLLKKKNDKYMVVDPPDKPRFVLKPKIIDDIILSQFSGEFLIIDEPNTALGSPLIQLENSVIDLGYIALTEKNVVGEIKFKNIGTRTLEIYKVSAGCSCYIGFTGDMQLGPEQNGKLQIRFDKNKLPDGPIERVVRIMTNDFQHPIVKVSFKFVVQTSPKENDIKLLPQQINYGRLSRENFCKSEVPFCIITPNKMWKVSLKTNNDCIKLTKISEPVQDREDGTSEKINNYILSWEKLPFTESVNEKITITIVKNQNDSNEVDIIELPIKADIINNN